jgi:hypothetical protein
MTLASALAYSRAQDRARIVFDCRMVDQRRDSDKFTQQN